MATTKRNAQSKNELQANLAQKPVERKIVLDGNLQEVTDEATKAHAAKSPMIAKPKAEREAEKSAMSAHLTDEEIAAIQASDANSLYAFLSSETQIQPTAKHGRKLLL